MVFIVNDQKQNHKKEQGYSGQYAGLGVYNAVETILIIAIRHLH